jgi:hypothetical protein
VEQGLAWPDWMDRSLHRHFTVHVLNERLNPQLSTMILDFPGLFQDFWEVCIVQGGSGRNQSQFSVSHCCGFDMKKSLEMTKMG